MTFYRSI